MFGKYSVVAVLACGVVWGQAPSYSAASVVNASDYSPGPFAPNSVLSIFGSNLSWSDGGTTGSTVTQGMPTTIGGTSVYVNNQAAPLLYASATQVNFVVPGTETAGNANVVLLRQGVMGPSITLTLVSAAPALFGQGNGFAIATHLDGSLLTDASPAQPGEIVVIYATGLGATQPNQPSGQVPGGIEYALCSVSVLLNGVVAPADSILYAGVAPGFVGLYQINLILPSDAPSDPTIQLVGNGQGSAGNLLIAIR